jgi:hypothetical protein
MFELNQSKTYTWPVSVQLPVSGGKFETQHFDAEFKRLTSKRLDEVKVSITENTLSERLFIEEVFQGWRGVTNGGEELAFTPSTRDELLSIPGVIDGLIWAFLESVTGQKRKN